MTKTSAEAQNNFEELLDLAQREPVAILQDGRPAAYLISLRDMEDLESVRKRRSQAVNDLAAWREKYKDQISPEAAHLSDEEINRIVHESR